MAPHRSSLNLRCIYDSGAAAPGRNGGQALLGWSCDMPPLEKALGVERTPRLWDSMCWAADDMRELPQHGATPFVFESSLHI